MKVILPSVEILRTGLESTATTPEEFIEKVGRTCYKSEDKITNDSAEKFVSNLIKRGHEAMIEHWNLIFRMSAETYDHFVGDWEYLLQYCDEPEKDRLRPYIRFTSTPNQDGEGRYIVSGNIRAWRDYAKAFDKHRPFMPEYLMGMIFRNPLFFPEFQQYSQTLIDAVDYDLMTPVSVFELTEAERRVHQNVTMKFVCDRGVSHEMVRHRVASFAQESTRYCNYGLDKFGQEITVIRPYFLGGRDDGRKADAKVYDYWQTACECSEKSYFSLLGNGATPQEARSVLPNSLKTEIIVTMNLDDWEHFFDLRCAPTAHPDMREVAIMARELFQKKLMTAPVEVDEASNN